MPWQDILRSDQKWVSLYLDDEYLSPVTHILMCLRGRISYNTQHTTHNTQHTTHNTQHTTHNTQHTTHNTQHTTHNTQTVQLT